MEKQKLEKKPLTMFDFLENNSTIYDVLGKYAGITDYSSAGVMKWLKEYSTVRKAKNVSQAWCRQNYINIFDNLMDELSRSITSTSEKDGIKPFPKDEIAIFLFKLQKIAPDRKKYMSVGQYINDVREALKNGSCFEESGEIDPYYDILIDLLTDKATEHVDQEKLNSSISTIVTGFGTAIARNNIKSLNLGEDVEAEEVKKLSFIEKILRKPEERKKYDELLEEYNRELAEHKEKVALRLKCKAEREEYVRKKLIATMPVEEKVTASRNGVDSIVFRKGKQVPPKEGSFSWSVDFSKKPEVIMDELAEYSKNGEENQRVVAIDYGKFKYSTLFQMSGYPSFSSDNLHIVGVTRIGNDGVKNYFVIMPLEGMKLKKASELTEHDIKVPLRVNSKKTSIRGYSDFEDYVFVKTPKIPDSKKDFYAKVALSDYMLEKSIQENYRYAGQVKETPLGPGIDASDSAGAYDLWAIQYAYDNPGACGRRKIYSLETILNDPELLYRHLKNVQGLYPEKYYTDNKVITENGYREISEDDNQRT